jgi:hypothetical protein
VATALKEARVRAELWEHPQCIHLGEPTGDWNECQTCTSTTKSRVFKCNHPLHETTTLRECDGCKDRLLNERT